ncbi:hypothetical protein [Burkholderia lata]|uniref:hypothetical protein n=1 Tax=Burkholderia lata (strain ATCC 17760 / DSM 23089 / LMG 22485 / NCIMB 9086 / R18194 / 383) TaxID=482957 RepID=UPI0015832C4F|nr:hypothetical protein [Burkholderia lata]
MASPKVGMSGDIDGVGISGNFGESVEHRTAGMRSPAGDNFTIGLRLEWRADDARLPGRQEAKT